MPQSKIFLPSNIDTFSCSASIPLTKTFRWHSNQQASASLSLSKSPFLGGKRTKSVEESHNVFSSAASSNGQMLRRTFSSHVSEEDFVQNSSSFPNASSLSLESGERLQLPHFKSGNDAIKRICADTLSDLIEGKYAHLIDEFLVVDCRFHYEYQGGHITNAINMNSVLEVEKFLLSSSFAQSCKKKAVIFHCEFSSYRAPRMALHVRKNDRLVNANAYPNLLFPEMYILEGGYKEFYAKAPLHCSPQCYIQMEHEMYKKESVRLLNEFKNEFSGKKKSKTISCASTENSPAFPKQQQRRNSFSQKLLASPIAASAASPLSQRQLFAPKVVVIDTVAPDSPSLLLGSDDFASWEDLCDATNSKTTIIEGSNVFF